MQTIPVAFAIALSFILFFGYVAIITVSHQRERTLAMMHVISRNLQSPLLFEDDLETVRVLASLKEESEIEAASVLSHSGSRVIEGFSSQSPTAVITSIPQVKSPTSTCEIASCVYFEPIMHQDRQLGVLATRTSNDQVWRVLGQILLMALVVSVAGGVVAYRVARSLSRSVTVPVAGLLKVVREISADESYHLRAQPLKWSDVRIEEIDSLAGEFDRMLESIERRDHALAELNHGLEQKVEERTEELALERVKGIEAARLASLGEMASGIAHEINNPLAVIQASAEIITSEAGSAAPDGITIEKQAARILKVSGRITKIVKGLRTIARDGTKEPFEGASFASIVEETVDLCQTRFKNSGVDLRVPAIDPEWKVSCRSVQISQVLLNLLNNAFDAVRDSGDQGGWVAIDVVEEASHSYALRVTDNGPGVPAGLEAKILQPFFTTKPAGKGTGLGLSISRSIMEEHGGTLTLERADGKTRFVLRFPKQTALTADRTNAQRPAA